MHGFYNHSFRASLLNHQNNAQLFKQNFTADNCGFPPPQPPAILYNVTPSENILISSSSKVWYTLSLEFIPQRWINVPSKITEALSLSLTHSQAHLYFNHTARTDSYQSNNQCTLYMYHFWINLNVNWIPEYLLLTVYTGILNLKAHVKHSHSFKILSFYALSASKIIYIHVNYIKRMKQQIK